MARPPKVWFWEARNEYCVNIKGERHRLGPDKEEAEKQFHLMMANQPKTVDRNSVVAIVDQYLDWLSKSKKHTAKTYKWYKDHLLPFLESIEPDLLVSELKTKHVYDWADSLTAGDTVKRSAISAVGRVFNWARDEAEIIAVNPIPKLKKPAAGSREIYIPDDEYAKILTHVTGEFRDVILTARDTGARPQEILRVEARHFDQKQSRWVFPIKESKGKKKQRIVYLTGDSLEITKRLAREHPEGPIFRNSDGNPWTPFSMNCCFRRLQVQMGASEVTITDQQIAARVRAIEKSRKEKGKAPLKDYDARRQAKRALTELAATKNATKYCLYAFRHTYCTNTLKGGMDPVTCGKLMGHADLKMIYKIYALIAQDPAFMLAQAQKAKK